MSQHLPLHHTPVRFSASAATLLLIHTHTHTHTFHLKVFPLRSNRRTYDSPSAALQSDSLSVCGAQNGGMKTLKLLNCPCKIDSLYGGFGPTVTSVCWLSYSPVLTIEQVYFNAKCINECECQKYAPEDIALFSNKKPLMHF